jgi:hypothetical protein
MKTIIALLLSIAAVYAEENAVVLNPGYKAGEYSFSGTVETEMGAFKTTHTFTGKTKHDSFECGWVNDMGVMKSHGEVKIDKQGGTVAMDGMAEQKFTDPATAIASATGVSGGSVHLMYALWTGERSAVLPSQDVKITKVDDKTEVSGENGSKARHSVVTMVGGMVASVKSEFDPSLDKQPAAKMEMSEQQIKDILKAMGKPETQEEIDKLKDIMKQAQSSMANLKEKIITTTKVTVTGLLP